MNAANSDKDGMPDVKRRLMRKRLRAMIRLAFQLKEDYYCPLSVNVNEKYKDKFPTLTLRGCDWCRFHIEEGDKCRLDEIIAFFKNLLDFFEGVEPDHALEDKIKKSRLGLK